MPQDDVTQPAYPQAVRAAPRGFLFATGAASDIGCRRKINEDSYLARPEIGLWMVADGMGGHAAGDFASEAVRRALSMVGAPQAGGPFLEEVQDRLNEANDRIQRHARHLDRGTIGTTVAALLIHDQRYTCLWAGDSRIYLLRAARLVQLTRDHTEARLLLDAGQITEAEAAVWPRRNVITRAVGVQAGIETERVTGPLQPGDRLVLCSDGLTGHLSDAEIAGLTAAHPPQEACDAMVALTLERGARDNVTVLVVHYAAHSPLEAVTDRAMISPGGSGGNR